MIFLLFLYQILTQRFPPLNIFISSVSYRASAYCLQVSQYLFWDVYERKTIFFPHPVPQHTAACFPPENALHATIIFGNKWWTMVHENYPKLNRSVSKALAGCSLGHQSREGHMKKGPGRYPGYHTSVSLIISLASHFQLSYLNWSIEYCRTLFTWLLSAQLLWLLSLFLLSKREIHYSVRKPHSFRACAYSSNSVSTHTLWQYFLYTELLHSPAF